MTMMLLSDVPSITYHYQCRQQVSIMKSIISAIHTSSNPDRDNKGGTMAMDVYVVSGRRPDLSEYFLHPASPSGLASPCTYRNGRSNKFDNT